VPNGRKRQPSETDKAFRTFEVYRHLGVHRTLRKLYELLELMMERDTPVCSALCYGRLTDPHLSKRERERG
jgi:hypothetical protein